MSGCCRTSGLSRTSTRRGTSPDRDHAGSAHTDVVLQTDPRSVDLTAVSNRAAKLLGELCDLRQSRGTDRVPLGEQTPGWVDDDATAVCVVALFDELLRRARCREAQGLVGEDLVDGEAVMQFNHVDVGRAETGLFVGHRRRLLRDAVSDDPGQVVRVEAHRRFRRQSLSQDPGTGVDAMGPGEVGRADDDRCGAVGGRARLQPRQRLEQGRRGQHLLDRHGVTEDRVRVGACMLSRLDRHLGKGFRSRSVSLHVVGPRSPEEQESHDRRTVRDGARIGGQ